MSKDTYIESRDTHICLKIHILGLEIHIFVLRVRRRHRRRGLNCRHGKGSRRHWGRRRRRHYCREDWGAEEQPLDHKEMGQPGEMGDGDGDGSGALPPPQPPRTSSTNQEGGRAEKPRMDLGREAATARVSAASVSAAAASISTTTGCKVGGEPGKGVKTKGNKWRREGMKVGNRKFCCIARSKLAKLLRAVCQRKEGARRS